MQQILAELRHLLNTLEMIQEDQFVYCYGHNEKLAWQSRQPEIRALMVLS